VKNAINQNGFAIIPEFLTLCEINLLLEGIAASNTGRSRAGVRHALSLSPVANLARRPNVIELARSVVGPSAFPFRAILFEKSPRSNWFVAWHQDKALPIRERQEIQGWGPWSVKEGVVYAHAPARVMSQVLALRIHLDDSTTQNGPLRVLPGTHKLGVLKDNEIHDLVTKIPPTECLVPAGGILAMRPLLIHSSSKSHAKEDRRVLHIEYAASHLMAAPLNLAIA
jgi:ectoine hydroxylase-related dioxygenase (phytanoyl-CoA dioxygenase family)